MKKILATVLVAVLALSLVFFAVACNKNNGSNKIRLNEVTHSVFYAPLYVAINEGYFTAEGLEIELTNGGGADKSMTAVISGQADIGLMGPEAAVYVNLQESKNSPVVFAQLTKRDGSFLMGRTAQPNFKWSDLSGAEIIGGRRGGMPAMCLEYVLTRNNLMSSVNLRYDIDFNLITAAFEGGTGDYCTMFEPAASQYVSQNKGYIVASVGEAAGAMPYTCFMATSEYMKNNKENVTKFMNAIIKGMKFVQEGTPQQIAKSVAPSFPGTDLALLESSIARYKEIDAYSTTPIMTEESFENMIDLLISCQIIDKRVSFADIIDNSIAQELMK